MTEEELHDVFQKLGARDPDGWAKSEIEEDIPQLARFLFLKGAWDEILSRDDLSWIDRLLESTPEDSTKPYAGAAHAIRRLLAIGASKSDIAEIVRSTQARFLFEICYLLDDSASVAGNEDYTDWELVEIDKEGRRRRTIQGLYESVLTMDPTGEEIRPKTSKAQNDDK